MDVGLSSQSPWLIEIELATEFPPEMVGGVEETGGKTSAIIDEDVVAEKTVAFFAPAAAVTETARYLPLSRVCKTYVGFFAVAIGLQPDGLVDEGKDFLAPHLYH